MNRIKELVLQVMKNSSIQNGAWLYLLQVMNTIIPLLTIPYITRILGSSTYGLFTIALNIFGYYLVVVEYGFNMSATRKIALSFSDRYEVNKTFTCVFFSRLLLAGMCVLLSMLYFLLNHKHLIQCICLFILLLGLIGSAIQQDWLFHGMQDMKYTSIANMISRVISTLLIFCFVKTQEDIFLYCVLYSISPLICGFLGLVMSFYKYHLEFVHINISDLIFELKTGFYVFTTQLSSKVFGAVGITFLGIFCSSSEVGIFSAIQTISNIMVLAWGPISQVMYPVSSGYMKKSFEEGIQFVFKLRKIFLPVFILFGCVVGLFSKPIILILFGLEYAEFYYWIFGLLIWFVLGINNNFLGIQILLSGGYDKNYSKCFQVSVFFTILFNLIFILLFGGFGASIAPALAEFIMWIMLKREIHCLRDKQTEVAY